MSLKYTHPVTDNLAPYREFIDDLVDGARGIQEASVKYLPKEAKEAQESYNSRLAKATYFDHFNPTVNGITGLIFKDPIVYQDDIPSQVANTLENADMQGNHFDILIEMLFKKALQKGISFCLVDMPKAEVKSKADEIKLGIRPYYTIIEPENVTSWKTETINGQLILSQVKIREFIDIEDQSNPYATKSVERYRVLSRGTYQVFEIVDGNSMIVDEGNTNLDFIPLFALNLNAKGFFNAFPPFYDLGKMNIAHYQVFADSRYSAHVASVPFYFGSGIDKEDTKGLIISPNTFFSTHNPDAKIEIVDYKGDGVAVNATLLDRIETKMREIGLSVISQDKTLTATEVNISSAQSQSKLNGYVRNLVDTVELILQAAARMYGLDSGGSIAINADILTNPLTSADIVALNNIVTSGNMSIETMYKMLASGSFRVPDDFDIEAEKELIASQGLVDNGDI